MSLARLLPGTHHSQWGTFMASVTIEHLLDHITYNSTSEAEKGSRFERLIQAYLRTASDYQGRFGDVWLWNEWPGRRGSDEGIDLVTEDLLNGGLCAVQCSASSTIPPTLCRRLTSTPSSPPPARRVSPRG